MQKQKTVKTTGEPGTNLDQETATIALPQIEDVLTRAETTLTAKPVRRLCSACGETVLNPCKPA